MAKRRKITYTDKKGKSTFLKEKDWQRLIGRYKFHKVGIIKSTKFGRTRGTSFGAFGHCLDGTFGLSLEIIEEDRGFAAAWAIPTEECKEFFDGMHIDEIKELIGKPVLLLSNNEALNGTERVLPHKELLRVWEKK